jgi:hypothetical protein
MWAAQVTQNSLPSGSVMTMHQPIGSSFRATPWPLRRRGVEHAAEHARDPRSLAARRHFWEDTLILVSVTSWGDPNCVSLDMTQRVDLASVLDWLESEFGLAPPA